MAHETEFRVEIELSPSLQNLQDDFLLTPNYDAANAHNNDNIDGIESDSDDNRMEDNLSLRKSADWVFSIPFRNICVSQPLGVSSLGDADHRPNGNRNGRDNGKSNGRMGQGRPFRGWKFASKFTNWSLESQNILTVTYVQAVHALPSYTNKNVGVDYVQRMFKRAKCSRSCFKKARVYVETYDASDILRVDRLSSDHVNIRGFSHCEGIQIMLRRKFENGGTHTRFSTHCDEGVEQQGDEKILLEGEKVHGCVQTDQGDDGGENHEDDDDDDGISARASLDVDCGAIVTFVMPMNTSLNMCTSTNSSDRDDDEKIPVAPPLLWKVQMPPDPSIALEAITVLDGSLNVHPQEKDNNYDDGNVCSNDMVGSSSQCSDHGRGGREDEESYSEVSCTASHPTNIYINGYQSWSFTGSVTQGDEQPKSAMPDFLSKAFNYGGEIPPPATDDDGGDYRDDGEIDENDDDNEWVGKDGSEPMIRGGRGGGYVRPCSKDGIDTCNFQNLTHYKSDFFTCVSCTDKEDCSGKDAEEEDSLESKHLNNCPLDENSGPAMVLGFLSQRRQYGLITFDSDLCCVAMHASFQRTIGSKARGISTDWAYCQILPGGYYDEEPMAFYLNAVSAYNGARPFQNFPPLTGWCSWYHYYENIDSASLHENFSRLKDLNSTITSDAVIIDDGYITAWGDWDSLKPKSFPKYQGGMKSLAEEISRNGMIPGLWIAPYACDKHSKLAKEHPDWIIRNDEGRFANSSNCGKFFYGLDATNPAVREYAFKCIRRAVKEWGFRVLKLDFLYAACLHGNGKYDRTMSRAETMYLALQTLRAAAGPDTFIIGCGCPIGPAIGLVDANRISADTGPTWYPDFPLPWWDHGTLPSLRAMVRNTVTRSSLGHRFWHNDPDCILLGATTRLTKVEIVSAATIVAMTGGMLLLSDDLSKLENDRLKIATRIYPVTGVTAVTLDLHNTSKSGIPCIMRLWCTDKNDTDFMNRSATQLMSDNAKRTAFAPQKPWMNPWKRQRNCLHVADGLGTWSLVSLSNWLDEPAVVSVPIEAALPPNEDMLEELHLGYHVFNFWSEKYHWLSADQRYKAISKTLEPHQSEIFHIKPMSLDKCQYIGSDLHFTCGYEVMEFVATATSVKLKLRTDLKRSGFVYLFIPSYADKLLITSNGTSSEKGEVVFKTPKLCHNKSFYGGQVLRIWVIIKGDGSESDGNITVQVEDA